MYCMPEAWCALYPGRHPASGRPDSPASALGGKLGAEPTVGRPYPGRPFRLGDCPELLMSLPPSAGSSR